jgi:hypothetical protein
MMVEVFKTNVTNIGVAQSLTEEIHRQFTDHLANFDLDDCDNILRIQAPEHSINCEGVIALLIKSGFRAELLPDEHLPVFEYTF